ncbi:PadR family transcriptional regulator [Microbacterium gorillae]|uniref:PadR family transcriptional regulator n=1 Tax=Microbacterium gorillae TaxID=1231063 RepID=UPI0005913ED8|nr:PadR family transcriptional regulator [Microbacterium gorillae]
MNGSFPAGSGAGSPFGGSGMPGSLWEVMDQLRTAFDRKPTPRMNRGDVRASVLGLLAEKPMHGYQIIQEIEERSGGTWKPSAGSVYPTLQLLADEGLVETEESGGRKVYSLTEAGRAAAQDSDSDEAPWETAGRRDGARPGELTKAAAELAHAVAQIGRSGSSDQVAAASKLLEETKRKIYGMLAEG